MTGECLGVEIEVQTTEENPVPVRERPNGGTATADKRALRNLRAQTVGVSTAQVSSWPCSVPPVSMSYHMANYKYITAASFNAL